jgi:hypothetical protein
VRRSIEQAAFIEFAGCHSPDLAAGGLGHDVRSCQHDVVGRYAKQGDRQLADALAQRRLAHRIGLAGLKNDDALGGTDQIGRREQTPTNPARRWASWTSPSDQPWCDASNCAARRHTPLYE